MPLHKPQEVEVMVDFPTKVIQAVTPTSEFDTVPASESQGTQLGKNKN